MTTMPLRFAESFTRGDAQTAPEAVSPSLNPTAALEGTCSPVVESDASSQDQARKVLVAVATVIGISVLVALDACTPAELTETVLPPVARAVSAASATHQLPEIDWSRVPIADLPSTF